MLNITASFMKKYVFIVLLLSLTGVFSCRRLCGCVLPPEQPILAGRINNAAWEPALTDTIKNDTIAIWGKRGSDEVKLKFGVDVNSKDADVLLSKYDAIYTVFARGANGRLIYQLDNTAVNNKILLAYRQADNFLSGNANLTLKLTTPTGNMAFDTTRIYFSNLYFRVRLRK
jgi:hypothetical protein